MALSADLLRGYTEAIILRRLSEGESYGYAVNQRVSELSGGRFELKEATLYTAFRRLETAGCIMSRWGDEASGARRRYYVLTDAGRGRLEQECTAWRETRELLSLLLEARETEGTRPVAAVKEEGQ